MFGTWHEQINLAFLLCLLLRCFAASNVEFIFFYWPIDLSFFVRHRRIHFVSSIMSMWNDQHFISFHMFNAFCYNGTTHDYLMRSAYTFVSLSGTNDKWITRTRNWNILLSHWLKVFPFGKTLLRWVISQFTQK